MNQPIAITNHDNEVVVTFLNLLLADEYVLFTKTRTAHWNVDGSNYFELHVFLENQYNELDSIIDEIAEQIRSLGHFALGSLKDFLSLAQICDDNQNFSKSKLIFETLKKDHESIVSIIQHEINPISDHFNNRATADFLSGILEQHKKMGWMLRMFMSNSEFNASRKNRIIKKKSVLQRDFSR